MASSGWGAKKARGELPDKIKGLTGGAEDYTVEPFEMSELLIRTDEILKHLQQEEPEIHIKGVVAGPEERAVTREGQETSLKPMEFDCLMMPTHNRDKALTRKQFPTVLWLLLRGPMSSDP